MWVNYCDAESFPQDSVKLGKWLGIAHSVGSTMTYWILKENRMVIPRSTIGPLTKEETMNSTEVKQRETFDKMVVTKYRSYDPEELELFENDRISQPIFENEDDDVLTTVKETESAEKSPVATQERNTV